MSQLTETEIENLKSKLPPSHILKIQDHLSSKGKTYSDRYIRMTIKGERMNSDIMSSIIHVIEEHQKKVKAFKKKIEKI